MSRPFAARSVADLTGGTILASVEIAAPPERVFRALTDADEIVRWWGSASSYRTEAWDADLRVGGTWRSSGRGADGSAFSVGGVFLEIDPPNRLVQTWNPTWDEGQETIVTWQLAAVDGGTRLTIRHDGLAGRPASCQSHADGWELVLQWLTHHAAIPEPGASDRFFFMRLIPPRRSFADDMTPDERAVMRAHSAYWTNLLRRDCAIVFGPVADPDGVWGLLVLRAADAEVARALGAADPAIQSGRGFRFDMLPMPTAVTLG